MKLLALDTSSVACSVALQCAERVTARHEEQPREHTRLLMPMIASLLQEAGLSLADLDAIVLGNGPGSFIGMRIAASVAQGLAFGSSLRIVPVSSMAGVAARALTEHEADEVVVAQDAHMNEVYLGVYRLGGDGLVVEMMPEQLHGVSAISELDPAASGGRVAAGYGWQRYPELTAANQDRVAAVLDIHHPRAEDLLSLGAAGLESGRALEPRDVEPAYLRQKVAEKPHSQP